MTKTIEEAANEYATNWEAKHNIHNPELYGLIVDAYKASAERIMMLPLAFRMTAEEKERVRKAYKAMPDYGKNKGVECASCANYAARVWMERIFGADFFKEGK